MALSLVALLVLAACNGGGGAVDPAVPSATGDMLSPVANRGWNYQCPVQATGAQVRYTFPGYDDTVSYVPGCGITDWLDNTSREEIALISVGSYSSLGALSTKVGHVSLLDSALVALGLKRDPYKSLPGLGGML